MKHSPKHALSFSSIEHVVQFLVNYAEQNAILLPGRVPGYRNTDLKLLPSSVSKRGIWKMYKESAESMDHIHLVAYTTFCRLWVSLLPSIILMKPMSDLCWTCQKNSTAIMRAANLSDTDKSSTIQAAQEHLTLVQLERSFYKTTCDDCRQQVFAHFTVNDVFEPPPPNSDILPNSNDLSVHYSFDYAQQIHFPSNPLQPGPIFFLTPRKCSLFGVNCEAIPRQVNFLTDEAADCGKGANVVVSQLHYFFCHHGLGEKEVFLHCDNCCGQNKNSCMIQYLMWRTMTKLHCRITLSFLIVGHTKFAPDWCFGLVKRKYRRTEVCTMKDIEDVVNDSAHCNVSQLVADEDGSIIVPTLDWTDFFACHMKRFPGIKTYQHFSFDSSDPGVVTMKQHSDSVEEKFNLLKQPWSPDLSELPNVVPPKSLSTQRQWYLYDQIRPFCSDSAKNITCPLPSVPRPGSRSGTPIPSHSPDLACTMTTSAEQPPHKRVRLCGTCKETGHNSRSCQKKT